jgi:hypothetical protein
MIDRTAPRASLKQEVDVADLDIIQLNHSESSLWSTEVRTTSCDRSLL